MTLFALLPQFIYWNPDPVAFTIFSHEVRWYALCWCVGLLLGYVVMQKLYKRQHIPDEKFDPLFFHIFFGVIIGARLGHCLFYEPGYFLSHPVEMIFPIQKTVDGWRCTGYAGLSSHGGVIGMLFALYLYVKRTGVNTMRILDNMGICAPLTACFIRLGNLFNSEIVGKNFLYMLTRDDYAAMLKEAFDALSAEEQAYFQPTINEMASEAESLGLGENGKYALAWIKLWVESYNAQTDDGPICNTLVDASAKDQFGLLVYSKLRSVEESSSVSVNNIKVAAYEDGYQGIGGYGYCHYLFVTDNSPLPWTACAFIAYMTCTADGFSAWGKDIGGYSSNPEVAAENEAIYHHETGGMAEDGTTVEYAALNDHGYDWWTNEGKLVLEDPEYCASVSFTVGSWIEMLDKYSAG